jgi:3D (Asp-Asp-Asp) domain-containing protein
VNPTDNTQKAASLGGLIAATLITSALVISGVWREQAIREQTAYALQAKQLALVTKERELQTAQSQVAAQRTEIHELSSRSGGIQSVDAGPWTAMTATWYSPKGGEGDGKTTKSGTHVQADYTVAVDPSVIPLGSLVEVRFQNGTDRLYSATDIGSAVKGKHIDVFDWDEQRCMKNGRQTVMVRILVMGR